MNVTAELQASGQREGATGQPGAWASFAAATGSRQLCHSWLALLADELRRPLIGLTLFREQDGGAFVPVAIFPDGGTDASFLASAAQQALVGKRAVLLPAAGAARPAGTPGARYAQIAVPILIGNVPHGVVAVAVEATDGAWAESVLRRMQLGAGWLSNLELDADERELGASLARTALALDLLLVILERPDLQEASFSLVNTLAVKLGLQRVSLGLLRAGNVRLRAVSHTAHFVRQSETAKALEAAMEEAVDQDRDIVLPAPARLRRDDQPRPITSAHGDLRAARGAGAVATFLLRHRGKVFGALTLEYRSDAAAGRAEQVNGEVLARVIAPALAEKRELDRWLGGRLQARGTALLEAVVGSQRPLLKVSLLALGLAVLSSMVIPADYRVAAKAVIEGRVQRAAVAPFAGFVRQAAVRAGDTVVGGDVVATLDQRDLLLERLRWESKREQSERKYREAWAKHEWAASSVLGAELRQAEAQLALVRQKLQQTEIRAPFDGIVIAGDLSQRLGSPLEQGQILFEVAPVSGYRLILKVDERDIMHVAEGQRGRLVLASFTADPLDFSVRKITPVATADEGLNYFRVEAQLAAPDRRLNPGMEGVGKIDAGRRTLWWIWTHRITDLLRLGLWRWLP